MSKSKRSHIKKIHRKAKADKLAPIIADRISALSDGIMRSAGAEQEDKIR